MSKTKQWLAAGLILTSIFGGQVSLTEAAERVFYRYVNEQGVKVINHTIPPEYAQKGYEVVSASGRVIEVVEPAVPKELAAQMEEKRRQKALMDKWDSSLHRRYSTVADIEAAKKRKLLELEANISILESTIAGLNEELQAQQSRAADIERAGRNVPEATLTSIKHLQTELEDRKAQVVQREKEYANLAAKFDRDIARFKKIKGEEQAR